MEMQSVLKVKMYPPPSWFENEESGIKRVVEAYYKYLPNFGIELVRGEETPCDITASHAGVYTTADVAHTHGLYWSADHVCNKAELHTNKKVIESIKNALIVTVPSKWVQKTFERDMRFSPYVVGHGIEAEKWEHNFEHEKYVLWNKNRDRDVCTPDHMIPLASSFKLVRFLTTFMPKEEYPNIEEIGLLPHDEMKLLIQKAGVYLSTTKETFGIGTLEAMAAGVPVLGFAYGGNLELVKHGVNGYLATPGDYDDLRKGLKYCIENQSILGQNGKVLAREFSWEDSCEKIARIYKKAYKLKSKKPSVSVVVPAYNYENKVNRAIESAINQDFPPEKVIIVNDGSIDDTEFAITKFMQKHNKDNPDTIVKYIYQENSGVAKARNNGIKATDTKYVCCLDADDKIAPEFLDVCIKALEEDSSLGIAYTGLYAIRPDGREGMSPWPDKWDFDQQLARRNQVPTCNVMRREMFDRLGGYRSRYAPHGAGSEDAEFWTRCGAYGWKAKKVDDRGLFIYSWLSGNVSGNPDYHEVDWLGWHPWVEDGMHPFASYATPRNDISHLVRQYDSPEVSVIIPVGPGHGDVLIDALDSLEAQNYRKWEVVVVFDSPERVDFYKRVYPYIKTVVNEDGKPHGAGWARNKGVEVASAGLILFLDADDYLLPGALDQIMYSWIQTGDIIYTDYFTKGKMNEEDAEKFRKKKRLEHFDEKLQEGVVRFYCHGYNCELAQKQPQDPDKPYIWNLITSLVPTAWHEEIGGFDEKMESWEDWDYWIRMAKAGKCFSRIPEPLVTYRFYTGSRRIRGREIGEDLIQYLKEKYKGVENMACNCGKRKANLKTKTSPRNQTIRSKKMDFNDEDMVLIRYDHPNRGQHGVRGPATGQFYGYHGGGDKFYVYKEDVEKNRALFVPIEQPSAAPKREKEETPPPKPIKEETPDTGHVTSKTGQLTDIAGISSRIASEMNALGINTIQALANANVVDLMTIKGIGESRAMKVIKEANQML